MPMPRKPRSDCLSCKNETPRPGYKYCSNKCQSNYQYKLYIQRWLDGKVSGLQRLGVVSRYVKRYLREKHNNQCCLCGWSEVNVFSGIAPLIADHIDGNWRNNTVSNLRLICPNCDSLTATYAALNKGNGRRGGLPSNRAKEARLLVSVQPQ